MKPRAFLTTRYRVKLAKKPDADHWSGGPAYHRGAQCPTCKIPLLLLWDINCRDPRFPHRKFGSLVRLPLYYCWTCVSDLSYQVADEQQIRIHSKKRDSGPSFQYEPYPRSYPRRGLQLLEGVPDEIRHIYMELTARWESANDDDIAPGPTPREQKVLTEFFGHPVALPMCFFHHQLGGKPIKAEWADQVFECPNPDCDGKVSGRSLGGKRPMKFLAGILNDPWAGLPMVEPADDDTRKHWNYGVSVQYHICDRCWTILGCNRSD